MKPLHPLHCLVAATHTPFNADGSINLAVIERQAAHLLKNGISTLFINGSTAECSSLTVEERLALAQRWVEVAKGTEIKIVVHVGANSLHESRVLAAQAEKLGAMAIAALSPSLRMVLTHSEEYTEFVDTADNDWGVTAFTYDQGWFAMSDGVAVPAYEGRWRTSTVVVADGESPFQDPNFDEEESLEGSVEEPSPVSTPDPSAPDDDGIPF